MTAAAAGKPLTPQETWGLSPRHRRCKKNAHRRDPCGLTSVVVASERDGAGFPLELTRSFSLEGCGPMRQSPWRGGHARTVASGPSGTTTDLCPFTSHHKTRSWPLDKRPVSPGQASWRLALAPLAATKWYQLWRSRPSTQAQRK